MKICSTILAFLFINFHLHSKGDPVDSDQIAYLGVYASKVNPNLSHQLKLTENLYLSVERVEKGSPAENAGIQQFDILLQLDDQILINPEQLKFLVRSKKPQDEITLTFLRRGDKRNTTLVLGGINQPIEKQLGNIHLNNRFFSTRDPFDIDSVFSNHPEIDDLLRRHSSGIGQSPNFNRSKGRFRQISPKKEMQDDPLHQKPKTHSFSHQSSQNQVMVSDEEGTLEWTEKDGRKSLRATDPKGKVLFDGPIDTTEERETLTHGIRTRLNQLEKKRKVIDFK
jgi:hypothetical protein